LLKYRYSIILKDSVSVSSLLNVTPVADDGIRVNNCFG
jgi:hypothetical protein